MPQTEKDVLAAATQGTATLDGPTLDGEVPQEVTDAFAELYEGVPAETTPKEPATVEATPATQRGKQSEEEVAEELEGLDGVTGEDDPRLDIDDDPAAAEDDSSKSQTKEVPATEGADDAPTLSPLLMQAAQRNGWPVEDANEFFEADPERAVKTFERLLEGYNNLSAEYGKLGQTGGMPPGSGLGAPPAVTPPTPSAPKPTQSVARDILQDVFGKEAMSELKDKYDDAFVRDALEPMAEKFSKKLDEVVGPLQMQVDQYETEHVRQTCFAFLDKLNPAFNEFYGKGEDIEKLDITQRSARGELFTQADQIRSGMLLHGLSPSLTECLDRAHMRVASKHMSTLERKRITQSVKKRSQSITHRPSQKKKLGKLQTAQNADDLAAKVFNDAATEMGWDS